LNDGNWKTCPEEEPMHAIIGTIRSQHAPREGAAPETQAGRWFGFFPEDLLAEESSSGGCPRPAPGKRIWIQLFESDISYLVIAPDQLPRVQTQPPATALQAIAFEPVFYQGHAYLVMRRSSREVRLNGQPAQRIAVLRVGDQVQVSDQHLLHLSLLTRPFLGPCPAEHVNAKCPYCRSTLEAGTHIYVCPHCQAALHCQGDEVPEGARLECAKMLSECPRCRMPVKLTEEVAYVPE
jgi:DNA-directed RNA polymerase subunit RPC12/RpoP